MGTTVSSQVLTNEGLLEGPACGSRRREIPTFRFSETVLAIAFSKV